MERTLSRMLCRTLGAVVTLTLVAAVPTCMWQRQRAINEIGSVSTRFVRAASKVDLIALRDCMTDRDRANLPAYYTAVAASKIAGLNRDVRTSVKLEVADVKMGTGEAKVHVKRELKEQGTRLGKPVNTHIDDLCTVICVYDGRQWLVDLQATVKDEGFPKSHIALFRECLLK